MEIMLRSHGNLSSSSSSELLGYWRFESICRGQRRVAGGGCIGLEEGLPEQAVVLLRIRRRRAQPASLASFAAAAAC